jgi:hypothetical protein
LAAGTTAAMAKAAQSTARQPLLRPPVGTSAKAPSPGPPSRPPTGTQRG